MGAASAVIGLFWLLRCSWNTSARSKRKKMRVLATAFFPSPGPKMSPKSLSQMRMNAVSGTPIMRRPRLVCFRILDDISRVITLIISADLVLERELFWLPVCRMVNDLCSLIAIMLGRFRMTVPDCKAEYENLGQEVFGKPRMFYTLRYGVGERFKYKAARLEKVFKGVARRRNEQPTQAYGKITFPSERGLCKTLVCYSLHLSPCARLLCNVTPQAIVIEGYTVLWPLPFFANIGYFNALPDPSAKACIGL